MFFLELIATSLVRGQKQNILNDLTWKGSWDKDSSAKSSLGSWSQRPSWEVGWGWDEGGDAKCSLSGKLLQWITGQDAVGLHFKNVKEIGRELLSKVILLHWTLVWKGESYVLSRSPPILWLYDCSLSKIG